MTPRLQEHYRKIAAPALMKRFEYDNPMRVPRIEKVSLNMGIGAATQDGKLLDAALEEMRSIAGQQPVLARARKSIANFKLREGMPIGVRVTLRRERMWEFLDRLIAVALPRVRDFRGLSPNGFDHHGNYSMGIREHLIFPEVNVESVTKSKGLNITVVTTARTDEEGLALLEALGMPFRRQDGTKG